MPHPTRPQSAQESAQDPFQLDEPGRKLLDRSRMRVAIIVWAVLVAILLVVLLTYRMA